MDSIDPLPGHVCDCLGIVEAKLWGWIREEPLDIINQASIFTSTLPSMCIEQTQILAVAVRWCSVFVSKTPIQLSIKFYGRSQINLKSLNGPNGSME